MVSFTLCQYFTNSQWYDSSLVFILPFVRKLLGPKGGENTKGLSSSPFLVLNAKGGESIKPKAKGPHHHFKKIRNEFLIGKFQLVYFSISIQFSIDM
jgi:hypothetical protein